MALPPEGSLALTFPLIIAGIGAILFAIYYVFKHRHPQESDRSTCVISILGLSVTLFTSVFLPVDIFIVSYMKDTNGEFKSWAKDNETRQSIEDAVMYTYYGLYSIIFVFIFIALPFAYFFFEEKDEDGFDDRNARLCSAIKFTLVFFLVAAVLLTVGAVVPMREAPQNSTFANDSAWDKFKNLIDDLGGNRGEDALEMVLNILSLIGLINIVTYTGYGVSSWPIGLVRGSKSAKKQMEDIQNQHVINQMRINQLRDKERLGSRLSDRERRQLSDLEENERLLAREEKYLENYRRGWFYRLRHPIRFIQVWLGLLTACLGFLVWLSLLLTNIDKAMHSPGAKFGYALEKRTLPNPLDMALTQLQKVFPLDYILILVIVFFLMMSTISGIRHIGIRIGCFQLFKLREKRTVPQGLLISCGTLMFTVLGINIFMYCLTPQYATFGSQYYLASNSSRIPCENSATIDQCTRTRASTLLLRFFYKTWFFGAFYYWALWGFLGVTVLAGIYTLLRGSRSAVSHLVENDLEEEDERLIT